MIQFNLLPSVKLEYIKARRTKRMVIFFATAIAATSVTVLILLFLIVGVIQKKYMNDLSDDIRKDSKTLQGIKDLDKILTVQNQLNTLPVLHKSKPHTSRIFKYIQQLTPAQASISELKLDTVNSTLSISGKADTLNTINKFVDTLKFTEFKAPEQDSKRAFSEVVLVSFGRDVEGATYQIDMKYDPIIFDGLQNVELFVPSIITTRSETEKPAALFQPLTNSGQ